MALDRRHWLLLAAITLLGLALRLAAARGGLWLDEAWSAVYARDAATPLGVLLHVNHDNNHHLNTLWMQWVGIAAPPLAQRALSIVAGTASILVAARIAAARGAGTALATALLLAVSPLLVTYGSEARGYAPMLLALLVAVAIVDPWLEAPERRLPAAGLFVTVLLGMLAQLTLLFGLTAVSGWALWRLHRQLGIRRMMAPACRLLVPLLCPALLVLLVVLAAARSSPGGFQMGNYDPFSAAKLLEAAGPLLPATFGLPQAPGWLPVLAGVSVAILAIFAPPRSPRTAFYALAILAFPLAVIALRLPNSGFPRYYLLTAVAFLLLAGERIGHLIAVPGWRRNAAVLVVAALSLGSLVQDLALASNRRGDTGAALAEVARRKPEGASIGVDARSAAVIDVLAAQARYPTEAQEAPCPAPDFVYVETNVGAPPAPAMRRCGVAYLPIRRGWARGLSGMNWTLLARQPGS